MTAITTEQIVTTRRGYALWLSLLGIFAVPAIALPLIFLNPAGPEWFHLVFHILGIALCVTGFWLASRAARTAPNRTLSVMAWIVAVALVIWAFGHVGELITVLGNGGAHASPELFEDPLHVFFANFAVPGWMLSIVSIIVLAVSTGIRSLYRMARKSA